MCIQMYTFVTKPLTQTPPLAQIATHLEALLGLLQVRLLLEAIQVREHAHDAREAVHLRAQALGLRLGLGLGLGFSGGCG